MCTMLPSNLMELERLFKEEWEKLPQSRCAKPEAKRLQHVVGAKVVGASRNIEQRL